MRVMLIAAHTRFLSKEPHGLAEPLLVTLLKCAWSVSKQDETAAIAMDLVWQSTCHVKDSSVFGVLTMKPASCRHGPCHQLLLVLPQKLKLTFGVALSLQLMIP